MGRETKMKGNIADNRMGKKKTFVRMNADFVKDNTMCEANNSQNRT